MLWVLKRTVSMRRFFDHPKHTLKLMGITLLTILRSFFVCLSKPMKWFLHMDSEDSDKTGLKSRLVRLIAGHSDNFVNLVMH